MKILGITLFVLLISTMLVAAGRLPTQLQKQDEVMRQSKSFGGGIQIIKSVTQGSSLKRVWDTRSGVKKGESAAPPSEKEVKYTLYGIQASGMGGSPYARGGVGIEARSYGLSKQIMKRFTKKAPETPSPEPRVEPTTPPVTANLEPQPTPAS